MHVTQLGSEGYYCNHEEIYPTQAFQNIKVWLVIRFAHVCLTSCSDKQYIWKLLSGKMVKIIQNRFIFKLMTAVLTLYFHRLYVCKDL